MRKLTLAAVLLPALAAAAPPGVPRGAEAEPGRLERVEKRMRLARAIGLAEALDLDDAGALRVRDILARYDQRRAPLRTQLRDSVRILRDAAHGDQAAAGQVDQALQHARDARAQVQQLDAQMLDEIAKGLAPDKKARAALFLATFHHRAERGGMMMMMRHGPGAAGPRGARAMPAPPPGQGFGRFDGAPMTMGDMPDPMLELEDAFDGD
jgi:hypothetical protein